MLAFFYLFNRVLLAKETFHKLNRFLWLSIIPLSMLLPFLDLSALLSNSEQANVDNFLAQSVSLDDQDASIELVDSTLWLANVVKVLLFIYFIGVVVLFSLRIVQYSLLVFKIFSNNKSKAQGSIISSEGFNEHLRDILVGIKKKEKENCFKIVFLDNGQAPFSWHKYIFISPNDVLEGGREIITHEFAHVSARHSLDIMFVDFLIVLLWFNPAAWLVKQSLMQVHEYQADDLVISRGINIKNYQLLLIKKAVGQRLYSMTNNLNHSKLKNRITMMLKEKSSKWAYAKCLYALPLMFAVVSAFGAPAISDKFDEIECKCSNIYLNNYLHSNLGNDVLPVKLANEEPVSGRRVIKDYSDTVNVRATSKKVAKVTEPASVKDTSASKQGVEVKTNIKIEVVGCRDSAVNKGVSYIIVDGVRLKGKGALKSINQNNTESITVLKGDAAVKLYGEEASDGVLIITTKSKSIGLNDTINYNITAKFVSKNNGADEPIYVVGGKIYSPGDDGYNDIHKMDPASIESVHVIKGDNAIKKYGKKAKAGVVEIILKEKK